MKVILVTFLITILVMVGIFAFIERRDTEFAAWCNPKGGHVVHFDRSIKCISEDGRLIEH